MDPIDLVLLAFVGVSLRLATGGYSFSSPLQLPALVAQLFCLLFQFVRLFCERRVEILEFFKLFLLGVDLLLHLTFFLLVLIDLFIETVLEYLELLFQLDGERGTRMCWRTSFSSFCRLAS